MKAERRLYLNCAFVEVEPLLHDSSELADAPALLSEDVLGPGC